MDPCTSCETSVSLLRLTGSPKGAPCNEVICSACGDGDCIFVDAISFFYILFVSFRCRQFRVIESSLLLCKSHVQPI